MVVIKVCMCVCVYVCAVCLYYSIPLPVPLADVDECTEGTLERHQLSRGEQLHQGHMHTFIHQTVSIATRIRQLLKDVCRINDKRNV